jgi:hypothetical protein
MSTLPMPAGLPSEPQPTDLGDAGGLRLGDCR